MLARFVFFAFIAGLFFSGLIAGMPIVLDFSAWYAGASLFGAAVIVALILYAFWVSLGGRSLLGEEILKTGEAEAGG